MAARDRDRDRDTNWLLWGGLALVLLLLIFALPLLNQDQGGPLEGPGTSPGGEAEQAEEEQLGEANETVNNTTTTNQTGQEPAPTGQPGA